MQALHDVVQAGYVRYIGMSSCWAWQCASFVQFLQCNTHLLTFMFSRLCFRLNRSPRHAKFVSFSLLCIKLNKYIFADYAITNKLTPFISMQNHHSLVYREEEREMFPTCKVPSA